MRTLRRGAPAAARAAVGRPYTGAMRDDETPPPRDRPLKFERVGERVVDEIVLRYPLGREAEAEAAAATLQVLVPVVERYLGAPLEGRVRLDLLEEARASGANPAVGVVRHALRGFSQRSPRAAGLLSYQLGRILWYRASGEAAHPGPEPRLPDWLLEAALLPLMHVWGDHESWLDYLAEGVRLLTGSRTLEEARLADMSGLEPQARRVALAQALLRGQVLQRLRPDWVRELRARLHDDPALTGEAALERLTGESSAALRARFEEGLRAATAAQADSGVGPARERP